VPVRQVRHNQHLYDEGGRELTDEEQPRSLGAVEHNDDPSGKGFKAYSPPSVRTGSGSAANTH
jgi:hypothetical protein